MSAPPQLPEDEAGTSGPYLWVALPQNFLDVVPLNATSLVLEWVAMLDPVAAVRRSAQRLVAEGSRLDWFVTDRFVRPTAVTVAYLRATASDEQVIEAFRSSDGLLRFPEQARPTVSLARLITDEQTLANASMPVLLGLAVVATEGERLGYKSHEVRLRRDEAAEITNEE